MKNEYGNYTKHAQYMEWGNLDHDRSLGDESNYNFARQYGNSILIPMCAWGHLGAYMAERGMNVTAFDITPEMIDEGIKRFGNIKSLNLLVGDATNFRFDIEPVDVCAFAEFGWIHSIDEIKKALVCINNHLRDGGYLIIEEFIGVYDSQTGLETFRVKNNPYTDRTVYKTGITRNEAKTRRCYISQTMYIEYNDGRKEQFDHEFYLQGYSREEWLAVLIECGFEIGAEYKNREKEPWCEGDEHWIVEAVKSTKAKKRYSPAISFDYLQTPIYRYENVSLYNDKINLEQPNSGFNQFYRFDINADGNWVGFIHIWIGYSIRIHYCGQIGYGINEQYRKCGYATKACFALKPFLQKCGFMFVTITNDENNTASRRVCEKIGAKLLETIDTPTWSGMYGDGQRRTCIYEWEIEEASKPIDSHTNLRHYKINLAADREYILERHCRVNYECDTPWARQILYDEYKANWFANINQQDGFLSALRESMDDTRTIAEIIKTKSGETVAYLWVPFHGEDSSFIWSDVQDVYVEDSYRKTGVAAYLMDYAEKMAKTHDAKVIRSGTGCENVKSQGLHKKMGYYQYRMEYEKVLKEDMQND